jgi:3-phosphoshikimate 1-carboxyvinyltransferase
MRVTIRPSAPPRGEIRVPGDKSLGHRALLLGALSGPGVTVRGLPDGQDVQSTRRVLERLGVPITDGADGSVTITAPRVWNDGAALDCGNSGTTVRLLTGLLAGRGVAATLDGDASLRRRPMRRIVDPLRAMGAPLAAGVEGSLPLRLDSHAATLRGAEHAPAVASAQVKSAILLAGLGARGTTTVHEPALSRDHTERMLVAMGADLTRDGRTVTLVGRPGEPTPLGGLALDIPGDLSTAAFFLAAGVLVPGAAIVLPAVGVNPTRTGLLEVLQAMDAPVVREPRADQGGEPVADLRVRHGALQAATISGDLVPRLIDELPLVAVLATQARGTTLVRDAGELRHKESDRIATVVTQLRRLGADIVERADGFAVTGPVTLRGTTVDAGGDHRLAMALAIAALAAVGETVIEGAEVAAVSYPGFWDDLGRLTVGAVSTGEEAA